MDIGSRIRLYRRYKGLKLSRLAKLMGISTDFLSEMENEKTEPDAAVEALIALIRDTDINPSWLLNGEGEMILTRPKQEATQKRDVVGEMLLILFQGLDEEKQLEVLEYLEKLKLEKGSCESLEGGA